MFFRALTPLLLAASLVSAWPIVFYPTNDCHSDPVLVLHEPPHPGKCGFFRDVVKSYSGGTEDTVQKMLLYYQPYTCDDDAAHRSYSNHTINNSANKCIPFKKQNENPRAFAFIEELLPPKNITSEASGCNALRVQS